MEQTNKNRINKDKNTINKDEIIKKYKFRFRFLLFIFIFCIITTAGYIYLNYDYLMAKHFISGFYIYTDTLDKVFEEELERNVEGNYYKYFDTLAVKLITDRIREENGDKYTYVYLPEKYAAYQENRKVKAGKTRIESITSDTAVLYLTNFSNYTYDFMNNNIDELKKYENLIIDLTDNYGGDIDVMVDICDLFLPKLNIIAYDDMRLFDWTYSAKKNQVLKYKSIIILQGSNTASASENMITALKDNLDNVTLIGEKTFGKGIGQTTMSMKMGFKIKATTLLWNSPEGYNIHGIGIEPDISITYDNLDVLIEKALEVIQSNVLE